MLSDRAFPFRGWIELVAWLGLAGLLGMLFLLPLPEPDRFSLAAFCIVLALYLVVVFYVLFPRSDYAPSVIYATLVVDVVVVGLLHWVLADYLPNLDSAFVPLIVIAGMVSGRRGVLALAALAALLDSIIQVRLLALPSGTAVPAGSSALVALLNRGLVVGTFALTGVVILFLIERIRRQETESRAVAIEKGRMLEREQKRAAQLAVVSAIAERITAILDPELLIQQVVTLSRDQFGYYNIAVLTMDESNTAVCLRAVSGGYTHLFPPGYRQSVSKGLIGAAARTGTTVVVNDVTKDARFVFPAAQVPVTGSELCVPLKMGSRLLGVLDIQATVKNAFDASDVTAMETLANQIAVALENARLYAQSKSEAEVKAALLRELSHRVKNNLATIVGLLYLALDDETIPRNEILNETLTRVQSMAVAHTLLANSPHGRVDALELGRQIIADSVRQMTLPGHHISLVAEGAPVEISAHQAASLALILNELVTNAIKHCEDGSAELRYSVQSVEGQARIEFFSPGPGLPGELYPSHRPGGLGLQLIRTLVEKDLGGVFSLSSSPDPCGVIGAICFVPDRES